MEKTKFGLYQLMYKIVVSVYSVKKNEALEKFLVDAKPNEDGSEGSHLAKMYEDFSENFGLTFNYDHYGYFTITDFIKKLDDTYLGVKCLFLQATFEDYIKMAKFVDLVLSN